MSGEFSPATELVVAAYKTELGHTEERWARLSRAIAGFDAWSADGNLKRVPGNVLEPLGAVRDAALAMLNAHAVDMRDRRLALSQAVAVCCAIWADATKAVRASHTVKVSDPVATPAPDAGPRGSTAEKPRRVRDPSDGSSTVV